MESHNNMATKEDVAKHRMVDGEQVELSDAEREQIAEEWTPTVSERRKERKQEVREVREKKAKQPVTVSGNTYSASERAMIRIVGAAQRAPGVQDWSVPIPTEDGTYPQVTASEVKSIRDAIGKQVEDCYRREAELMSKLDAATTLDDLNAIDITTGWP